MAAAALAGTLAYGTWHLAAVRREMAQAPWVKIGLVQANVSQEVKNQGPRHAERIVGRMWPLTLEADRQGAALVAWPEASWPRALPPALPGLLAVAPDLEPLRQAHLLLGATTVQWMQGPEGRVPQVENSAFLLGPDLRVDDRYVKHHLVPFGEYVPLREWLPFLRSVVPTMAPIAAGGRLVLMSFESGGRRISFAPMICFDAIFPEVARTFVLQDADFLVNPTNDAWYGYSSGPYQFLAIVQHAGHRDRAVGGAPGLLGRERHRLSHRRARARRPRGRAGRSGRWRPTPTSRRGCSWASCPSCRGGRPTRDSVISSPGAASSPRSSCSARRSLRRPTRQNGQEN